MLECNRQVQLNQIEIHKVFKWDMSMHKREKQKKDDNDENK